MSDSRFPTWAAMLPTALMATSAVTPVRVAVAQQLAAARASADDTLATIVVTAQKRGEDAQTVPMSIQAMTSEQLQQLNATSFTDYVAFAPSISFLSNQALNGGPGGNLLYMRGVADGSTSPGGPLPTVATYLDEQPVTDITGNLDVHLYDVARIEVLPGPQGTLYGTSSEAGTLRIITNKPALNQLRAGYEVQGNTVADGSQGYLYQGFANLPLGEHAAIRLVGFNEHDAGFIDNVPASRTYATSRATIDNSGFARSDFNGVDVYGGRAALAIDLDDRWTVSPTLMMQQRRASGVNAYEPAVGNLQIERFGPDSSHDRWWQAALTIEGKIGNFDLTYAGAYFDRSYHSLTDYTDYSVFYDSLSGSGANWTDDLGKVIANPQQEVYARMGFKKRSHELRVVSPGDHRLRFVGGLFYQSQTADLLQPYNLNDYATALSVQGFQHAIFLIDQSRTDKDLAAFGEMTFDITDKLSLLAGIRGYQYRNALAGYYGFRTPAFGQTGSKCLSADPFDAAPCATFAQRATGSGETHKINLSYKFDQDRLIYATVATGFRPGGINRSPAYGQYHADNLRSYEIGTKTQWLEHRLIWNAAVYREVWNNFQFSFEGPNGTSIYQNAPSAQVDGAETSIRWAATQSLSLTADATYDHSRITRDFCGVDAVTLEPVLDCSAAGTKIQVARDTPLVYVPRFKGSLTAQYRFPIPGRPEWNGSIEANTAYRGSIPVYITTSDIPAAGPYYRLGGFTTTGLSAGLGGDAWRIKLFAKNLFNTHGALNAKTSCPVGICGSTAVPGVPQAFYVAPTQPRTIGVEFSQDFAR